MSFPNVTFESQEVDFGCILNDTEIIRYLTMTNTSPLGVRYTWSFLKRPPVQRPPDHDEGVDMESECESDSLDEESGDGDTLENGEGGSFGDNEEGLPPHSRPESVHIQIADRDIILGSNMDLGGSPVDGTQSPGVQDEDGSELKSPINEAAPGEIDQSEAGSSSPKQSEVSSSGDNDDVIESGLPPAGSEASVVHPIAVKSDDDQTMAEEPEVTKTRKKEKRKPQPWESTYDPFTPISIEQVSHQRYMYRHCGYNM